MNHDQSLEIVTLQLGQMENNSYLAADSRSGEAAAIDPSFESEKLLQAAEQRGWKLSGIWLTHAHFDHIAGVATIQQAQEQELPVGLHPADLPVWQQGGGAALFGLQMKPGPEPTLHFQHGQQLRVGRHIIEVRHTPGHSPGHVTFYAAGSSVVFAGDLIFYRGIGRTDLPGGSYSQLLQSIQQQILPLPPATRLLCGHGPETTVQEEAANNPFLA